MYQPLPPPAPVYASRRRGGAQADASHHAEVTRIYTRQTDGLVEDLSPLTVGEDTFEIVVEAEAGSVKYNDQSPIFVLAP